MKVCIEADGGSRGNPGVAGSGTVLYDATHTHILRRIADHIGVATNNVAEYHALINGLNAALELHATNVVVFMDSKLVVEQMSGRWKIKHPDMRTLARTAQDLMKKIGSVTYQWVPRAKNFRADELANIAMDRGAAQGASSAHALGYVLDDGGNMKERNASLPDKDERVAANVPKTPSLSSPTFRATRVILVRHGETPMSVEKRYCGVSDPELTETGRVQAYAASQYIADMVKNSDDVPIVFSSPKKRALEGAYMLADALKIPRTDIICDEVLSESDFGQWEGLTFAEAAACNPKEHAAWLQETQTPAPGGESLAHTYKRVHAWLKRVLAQYPGKTLLVVTHTVPILSLLRLALDAPAHSIHAMRISLGSISTLDFYDDGNACVTSMNIRPGMLHAGGITARAGDVVG